MSEESTVFVGPSLSRDVQSHDFSSEKDSPTPSLKKKVSSKSSSIPKKSSKPKRSNVKGLELCTSLPSAGVDDYIPVHANLKQDSSAIAVKKASIEDLEAAGKPSNPVSISRNQCVVPHLSDQTMNLHPTTHPDVQSSLDRTKNSVTETSSPTTDLDSMLGSISNETKEAILRLIFSNYGMTGDSSNSSKETELKTNDGVKQFLSRSVSSSGETESLSLNSSSSVSSKKQKARPVIRDGAYFTAIYLILIGLTMSYQAYQTISLTISDMFYYRLISFALYPLFFAMVMFPFRIAIYNGLTLFGSWRNVYINSKYHSANPPPKVPRNELPCVCVQMPIYKESFVETIQPSLEDIQMAIDHYREQGGEAFMFINDDGLQLISEDERQTRIEYFQQNNIAYIARPAPNILRRHGLFKKASNMNFCLNFAMDVGNIFYKKQLDGSSISSSDTDVSSEEAIQEVMESRSYPVLAGGPIEKMKKVQYILLVDSDTRVPETCLYDTVGEFVYDAEVGFVQHATSVLRVDDNYWEAILAHFTHLLYSVFIPIGTALGEPSPLVGHNATLNWQAIQEVSWYDDEVGYRKYWSESHVSEDFDLSMRLQSAGYIGRYALYTGDGFQEGVSVTVHDEIKKLKKYAFGSGEMLFNPCKDWCRKGPISPLLKGYLSASCIPWDARVNLVAYLFNYVSMFIGVVVVPLSFYLGFLDANNLSLPTAWQVMIGTTFIFGVMGTLNTVLFTLFLGHHQSFPLAFIYEVSRMLPLSLFFLGLSYHICTSFARYMLSLKAEWGATVKELDSTLCHYNFLTFLSESMKTIQAYWDMYVYLVVVSGLMAFFFLVIGPSMDVHWSGYAASPFCLFIAGHAAMPLIFNPVAMRSIYYPIRNCLCCIFMCPFIVLKGAKPKEPELPTNGNNPVPRYIEKGTFESAEKYQTSNFSIPTRKEGRTDEDMDATSHVSMDSASQDTTFSV